MRGRTVQVIGSFYQGGSERQAVQLSRLLHADGEFGVAIAVLNKSGPLLDEVLNCGFSEIQEYRLQSFFSRSFLTQLNAFRKYLRAEKIDIVHTHDFYTTVFGILAARLAGVRVRIASKRETSGVRTAAQEKIERMTYRIANLITVNAKAVKDYLLAAGVRDSKIHVTYNGLDLDRMRATINDRGVICKQLRIPEAKRFVTLVANVRHDVKNQPMLLRCAHNLREEFRDVHFVFAGEGDGIEPLRNLAKELGIEETCHFIGRCEIVPELLAISEICVLTSYFEGFSNSILEYMAAGKPVVATDVGGARECIDDTQSGFIVPSDDSSAMAAKLKILLNDAHMASRFGARGRAVVEERFSTEAQIRDVKNVYRTLLEAC